MQTRAEKSSLVQVRCAMMGVIVGGCLVITLKSNIQGEGSVDMICASSCLAASLGSEDVKW